MYGSVSLPNTFKMIFVLRKFTLSSVLLVGLWSFYYLGSQASQREYVHTLSNNYRSVRGVIPRDIAPFDFEFYGDQSYPEDSITQINDEFKSTEKFDPRTGIDSQGHLLVPDMRYKLTALDATPKLLNRRSDEELKDWMTFVPDLETEPSAYTSSSGIAASIVANALGIIDPKAKEPVWLPIGYDYSFAYIQVVGDYQFRTSYISVQCDTAQPLSADEWPLGVAETTSISFNLSSANTFDPSPPYAVDFDIWVKWDQHNIFYSRSEHFNDTLLINGLDHGCIRVGCTITRPEVEIKALCPTGGCYANKIRYLPTFSRNPFSSVSWSSRFFDHILRSTGPAYSTYNDQTKLQFDLGIYSLPDKVYKSQNKSEHVNINDTLVGYSEGLVRKFNTYFNIASFWSFENQIERTTDISRFDNFTLDGAYYDPEYIIVWSWIAVDYISIAILFVASIISFWLRKRTLAPDIFGYVSSLTRDNLYVPVTIGGSSLSGLDRARAMQKVKIRIADVGHGDGIGKVSVIYADRDVNGEPLSKNRKYL